MHRFLLFLSLALVGQFLPATVLATSVTPMTTAQRASEADAVFRATIDSIRPFRGKNGAVHTRATFTVTEIFKGRVPARLTMTYRGGFLNGEGETVTMMPDLVPGEDRMLFLSLHDNQLIPLGGPTGLPRIHANTSRTFGATANNLLDEVRRQFPQPAPGADLTDFAAMQNAPLTTQQAAPTVTDSPTLSSGAVPSNALNQPARRYTIRDRGVPIRYVIDDETLPPGISSAEAIEAVNNALAAWSEVSAVTFEHLRNEHFGRPAQNVNLGDETLAIQLHNLDGTIPDSNTLGIGGQGYTAGVFPDGEAGGRVGDVAFNRIQRGYVVLNHTAAAMQDLATFEAVLCHEIGHALGLAHSSEDPDESNPLRKEAIMYYAAYGEGRGATLSQWDVDAIDLAYPSDSLPPYGFDRVLRVVASPKPLANPQVNQVELHGYSAQQWPVTFEVLYPAESNGTFSVSGSTLTFTPSGAFSDSAEADLNVGYYDRIFVRYSDGTNLSPPVQVRVVQFLRDTQPSAAPDGLPDSWAQAKFGSTVPTANLSRAHDDPDGDELTNLQEFLFATDPQIFNTFAVTSLTRDSLTFPARPYDVYELQGTSDLVTWEPTGIAVRPTTTAGEIVLPESDDDRRFFRVTRVK